MKIINFEEYSNDFKWDYKLHFPVPTIDFVLRRTGEDLLKTFDNSTEAEGALIGLVRSAKNYLFAKRLDMKEWEYYIARDIDLLYDVLEYILEVVTFAYVVGDYDELYKVLDGKGKSVGLENAKNQLLTYRKVLPPGVEIRKGY